MKFFFRLLWWGTFIIGALVIQQSIPGIDALAPGFLLSLQEKDSRESFWLFPLFVLIQEGAGNISFGGSLLWYGGQVLLFRLSQRFFVAENLLFFCMLSAILGAYHYALDLFMCAVQKLPVDHAALVQESIAQALVIPVIWGIAYLTRPRAALGSA